MDLNKYKKTYDKKLSAVCMVVCKAYKEAITGGRPLDLINTLCTEGLIKETKEEKKRYLKIPRANRGIDETWDVYLNFLCNAKVGRYLFEDSFIANGLSQQEYLEFDWEQFHCDYEELFTKNEYYYNWVIEEISQL